MKLNLIKGTNPVNGKWVLIGWNLEAENAQEEKDLSIVRNKIFFGIKEFNDHPEYAGRTDNPDTAEVAKLWWSIPKNVARLQQGEVTMEDGKEKDFYMAIG